MMLSYRGVKYEAKIPVVTTQAAKVMGHYRGVELRSHEVKDR